MKKIVNINQLEFRYKKQDKLFYNFNLTLQTGTINGLLGKNGEGKTTLLKLMSGLLFPLKGKIEVNSFNPSRRNPKMLYDLFLLPEEIPEAHLSIKMYKDIYSSFYPHFSSTKFHSYLNEFSIDSGTANIAELSYGQRKKFFIAFGLSTNAKLILLDEPTNGLDIPSKRQFRRMISVAGSEKSSIVISTHQVVDLEDVVDNVIILENHDVVFNQPTELIQKKLFFSTAETNNSKADALYTEQTLDGFHQIFENKNGEKSKTDLELLFNAVISDHHRIKELFNI